MHVRLLQWKSIRNKVVDLLANSIPEHQQIYPVKLTRTNPKVKGGGHRGLPLSEPSRGCIPPPKGGCPRCPDQSDNRRGACCGTGPLGDGLNARWGERWLVEPLGVPPVVQSSPRSGPPEKVGENTTFSQSLVRISSHLVPMLPILTSQCSRLIFTDCMVSIAVLDFVENSSSGGITSSNV